MRILLSFIWLAVSMILFSCKKEKNSASTTLEKGKNPTYYFNNGEDSLMVEVKKTPQKVALFSHFMTEMFLALDLGDKIVLGTTEGEILPEFKEKYQKVPNKLTGHHAVFSKEAFLLLGVDFISGWDQAIRAETTGSPEELISNGIYPFVVKSIRDNEKLETVYEDFHTLGKIFGVEDRAKKVVNDMRAKLQKVQSTLVQKPEQEKKKIMIFSSIDNGIYVAGGLTTDLINKAGGKNVYEEIGADHEMVSFESMVHKNPDLILIAHLGGGDSFEKKVEVLKTHPALKDLPAVKENKIHQITLEDISPGVRNIDFIIKLNKLMYER